MGIFEAIVFLTTLFTLCAPSQALAHGDEHAYATSSIPSMSDPVPSVLASMPLNVSSSMPASYFAYPAMSTFMLAHIALMTIAWFFILPIGIMLSIARSRSAFLIQLAFLSVHSLGLLLGIIYTGKVPNLYPKNSHHRLGWIITWVVVAQCFLELVKLCISIVERRTNELEERGASLPISFKNLMQHGKRQPVGSPDPYRYSRDSGHFTASPGTTRTHSLSSNPDPTEDESRQIRDYETDSDANDHLIEKHTSLDSSRIVRYATIVVSPLSKRMVNFLDAVDNIMSRLILLLGFIALVSGLVVYGGVFRDQNVFNGLAHSIKGGIFFWYGLLTLGRWMGCFVELGWAWNVKPPAGLVGQRTAKIPSAEFVESFVIFLYGSTNVFLEHLAAWGQAWSAQDLEHVSISIMFFGGGLCGMLIESSRIRDLLNSILLTSPIAHSSSSMRDHIKPPRTYGHSLNPFPGLIILLLGLMMSSHHQNSMIATMVHKQWGTLFIGFALARAVTYIMVYLSPPTSFLPSRPPSELITSFCLISGGIIFMASNKDTVHSMEQHGLHAMFPFTVTMGFTAFLMAWVIIVLAVKGWAVRRQASRIISPAVSQGMISA